MSYKYDSTLTIMNQYGKAASDATAQMYETYDKLRDLSVSGPSIQGDGFGTFGKLLMNVARTIGPASFMPVLGTEQMNIPGTSYSNAVTGGTSILPGGTAAFGMGSLGSYPGFPTGSASAITGLASGIGSSISSLFSNSDNLENLTGEATSIANIASSASAAGAVAGTATGFGQSSIVLPLAGALSGIGGIATSLGPYLGPMGNLAGIAGYIASGFGGAVLGGYQYTASKIVNNADTILTNKVKNIETVVKQLNTQQDMLKKMLKDSIEGDGKAIQDM